MITLIDVLGRKVITQTSNLLIGENKMSINVSGYSTGIYLLQLETETGKYRTRKQIVVK